MQRNNKIIITTLCDNCAESVDVLAEWGFSILIETPDTTILFDTGATSTCTHNAFNLGKDLLKIKKIVLSHGHYDHTGGLLEVLKLLKPKDTIDVVAHPDIWQPKYAMINGKAKWVGMLSTPEILQNNGAAFQLARTSTWLSETIVTTGEISMHNDYECVDKEMLIKDGNDFKQDQLADDQALIIKTAKGLLVILGCSHRGVINTLQHAQRITQENRIYMVLGGTHLAFASPEHIQKTIIALQELQIQKIGVSHCTGLQVATRLAAEFKGAFFFNTVGRRIEIDV